MISDGELAELERGVAHALRTGDTSELHLLGHGEIGIVLGWPAGQPAVAVKRLPPFPSRQAYDTYAGVLQRFLDGLAARGVRVVDSEARPLRRDDGRVVGFVVQPVLPAASMVSAMLHAGTPPGDVVPAVLDAVDRAVSPGLAVDAQLSNWSWRDGEVVQVDVTPPMVFDAHNRLAMDVRPFFASMPVVLRPALVATMQQYARRFTTRRGVYLDLLTQLLKERLDQHAETIVALMNERPDGAPLTVAEARKRLDQDRVLWPVLLQAQKAQRWWTRSVRRRPYDFLLPEHTTYAASAS